MMRWDPEKNRICYNSFRAKNLYSRHFVVVITRQISKIDISYFKYLRHIIKYYVARSA